MQVQSPPKLTLLLPPLERAPLSINGIIDLIANFEDQIWFNELVKEFTPGAAHDVQTANSPAMKVAAFAEHFERRHFPLNYIFTDGYLEEWDMDEPNSIYSMLRAGIPYFMMGVDPDDVHEAWTGQYGPGRSAMMLIPRLEEGYFYRDDDIRLAWLEAAAEHIPRETLLRIPAQGIPMICLAQALEGTPMEAVLNAARWLVSDSGNFFIDENYPEGECQSGDPWEREVVEEATKIWKEAQEIMDPINKLANWLDHDTGPRFTQMLDFILDRTDRLPPNFDLIVKMKRLDDIRKDREKTREEERNQGEDQTQTNRTTA